jgi:hypothetical protein
MIFTLLPKAINHTSGENSPNLVTLLLGRPFSNYSFLIIHIVNRDDRHPLAHGDGL